MLFPLPHKLRVYLVPTVCQAAQGEERILEALNLKQVIPMSKCGATAHLACSARLQKCEGIANTEREQGLTACSEGMKWGMLGQVDSLEPHTNR